MLYSIAQQVVKDLSDVCFFAHQDRQFALEGNIDVFWRIDLIISSDMDTLTKRPSPFPEWSVGNSTLMNIIWAVKYHKRGKHSIADHYLASARDKLLIAHYEYSDENTIKLLSILGERQDTDSLLVLKARSTVTF